MELYRLLSVTEKQDKKHKVVKEWQFRIKKGLAYSITVTHNQDRDKVVVRLNECVLESRVKESLYLPITIEKIEFTVIERNGVFLLFIGNSNIEEERVVIENLLDDTELQLILVQCDSLLQYLKQQTGNTQDNISKINEQLAVCRNAQNITSIANYKIQLEQWILTLEQELQIIQQKAAFQPANLMNFQYPHQSQVQQQQHYETRTVVNNDEDKILVNQDENKQEESNVCIICMNSMKTHAPVPCGHLMYCQDCVKLCVDKKECFYCKSKADNFVKIYN